MSDSSPDLYVSIKPLAEFLFYAGSKPEVAVRLPGVADILTNVPVGNEQPATDDCGYRFLTRHKKLYIRQGHEPYGYICIGEITNDQQRPSFIENSWWFVCNSFIDAEWFTREFLFRYFRFDSTDFVFTLYGEFFSSDGYNAGNDWSGILLTHWSEIDLHDKSYHVSPVSDRYPFLLRLPPQGAIPDQVNPYLHKHAAKCSHVPVYFHEVLIGKAAGFRMVRLGDMVCLRFILYEYDKKQLPEGLLWKNHIVISDVRATGTAGRGPFITRLYVDFPPPELQQLLSN